MMDTTEFDVLPNKAQSYLTRLPDLVAGVVPIESHIWNFTANQFQPGVESVPIISSVAQWATKGNVYLYTISLLTKKVDLSNIEEAFLTKKSRRDGRAYPRINLQSRCLYVGRSRSFRQRLKDHLGCGAKSTYGLHLAYWAGNLPFELEFKCAKYPAGHAPEVYQILEDMLWDMLSPMFGRKGAK